MSSTVALLVALGGAVIGGQPAAAKGPHLIDDGEQRVTLLGQGVFDPRRHLGEALAFDDVRLFQPLQTLGERLRTDAGEGSLEFAEAAVAAGQITDDERGPLIADELRGARDRTTEIRCNVRGGVPRRGPLTVLTIATTSFLPNAP